MSLRPGEQLGPYEILAPLGAGGMGEVYRARDPRLGRDVALKVLPDDVSDPQRLRRFEEEARAVAALNHPHILAVYDIGRDDDTPYVVFELLKGQTLRERLRRGALPPRKVVEYAEQLCQGLAAAHARGIVHRDLKPANLYLTKDGVLKILDFGLARLTGPRAPGEETAVTETRPDVVLGTLGYLSPDQAQGKKADARSDVFAVGAVLYEMLSGQRAFQGETTADLLAAVLKEDPPELQSPSGPISPALDRIVRRCLEKEPDDRFQSAKDVAFALEALSGKTTGPVQPAEPPRGRQRRRVLTAALVIAAAGAGAAAGLLIGQRTAPPKLPTFTQITFGQGAIWDGHFTPDGETVVYSASWGQAPPEVFATRVGSPESRSLGYPPGGIQSVSSSGELALLLSAFGNRGMPRLGTLARATLDGGAPRDVLDDVLAASWAPDGSLCVMRRLEDQVRIEWPLGEVLVESARPAANHYLRVSPRGDLVAFENETDTGWDLQVADRRGERRTLTSIHGTHYFPGFAWAPDGDELWFGRVDSQTRNHVLEAADLSGHVRPIYNFHSFWLHDISSTGRVLIQQGVGTTGVRVRAPGAEKEREAALHVNTDPVGLSRNGQWLLTREDVDAPRIGGAYLQPTAGGAPVRIRGGQPADGVPLDVSNDGRWALFREPGPPWRLVKVPTGAGEPRAISTGSVEPRFASWLEDQEGIWIWGWEPGQPRRLYLQPSEDAPPRPMLPDGEGWGLTSPTMRWIATPQETGLLLYPVDGGEPVPVPNLERRVWPHAWSRDERFLFVQDIATFPVRIMKLEVATGRLEPWKVLGPNETDLHRILVATGGNAYVYSYRNWLANLYIVDGLE